MTTKSIENDYCILLKSLSEIRSALSCNVIIGYAEELGGISIEIFATINNHPVKGTEDDWVLFFEQRKGMCYGERTDIEYIGRAFFGWSGESETFPIILTEMSSVCHYHNNKCPDVLRKKSQEDIDWMGDQLEHIWKYVFKQKKMPRIENITGTDYFIPRYELSFVRHDDCEFSNNFKYIRSTSMIVRIRAARIFRKYKNAVTENILYHLITQEKNVFVLMELIRTINLLGHTKQAVTELGLIVSMAERHESNSFVLSDYARLLLVKELLLSKTLIHSAWVVCLYAFSSPHKFSAIVRKLD